MVQQGPLVSKPLYLKEKEEKEEEEKKKEKGTYKPFSFGEIKGGRFTFCIYIYKMYSIPRKKNTSMKYPVEDHLIHIYLYRKYIIF